jgi:hypothetical protein
MARLSRGKAVCTTTKILIAYAVGSHRDIVNALQDLMHKSAARP